MAVSNTDNRVQYSITSTPTTSTEYSYPNRVSDVTDIVVQETTQTPRIPGTITFNQSSDQFALTNHGLVTGNVVQFDGTAITGFTADIDYYVVKIDANSFQLATSVANATASPAVVVTVSGTDNVSVTTLIRAGEQPLTRTLTKDSDYTIEATFSGTLITSLTVSPTEAALNNDKFAVGSTITIYRETNFQQTSNYVPNQIIPADTLEGDLDKLAMMAQQLKDDVGRSVRFAESVTDPANLEIAFDADQRSGKLLSFDADGNFSVSQEIGVWRSAWQSGRAYSARDLVFNDDDTSDDRYSIYFAKTTHTSDSSTAPLEVGANWDKILDASFFATQVELAQTSGGAASDSADLAEEWASKVNGAVTGTTEYSSKAYAIGGTGVDGNAGSAKDWATKTGGTVDGTNYSAKHWATQEDVGTVATNISDIRAVAAIDTDVSAVADIDTAVSAVNANATNINTVAGQISPTNNVSTVAGVSADITAVAGQISPTNNISTVAGIDSDIQTVAGQISPTNNIATVAGISTEIQTVAGDSADIQTVATNILDVNNFADTYLGALATDPTDPPTTLLDGALYFNTTSNELRVYDLGTTTWIPITSPPQALDTTDSPTFAGVTVTTADINGGTIDGTTIGGTTPAAGTFTEINATTIYADYVYASNVLSGGSFTWDSGTSSPYASVSVSPPVVTSIHQGMRRCILNNDSGAVQYYLDANDSTKKADGTTANLDGTDGQVMVEIPKFYYRKTTSGTETTWSISQFLIGGYTVHPAFVKDGVEVDFRYIGAYDACVYDASAGSYISGLNLDDNTGNIASANDKLASVSGVYPMVGLTRAEFRTLAANRGTGWRQMDFTLWSAVQMLYLVEYQTFYSQSVLGEGNVNGSYLANSSNQNDSPHTIAGASNALFGNASTDGSQPSAGAKPGTAYMSYRGIENFYGNCWTWADGVNINVSGGTADGWAVTNDAANFADDTEAGHTVITTAMPADGYVTNFSTGTDYAFIPSSTGGSATTYATDYFYDDNNNTNRVLHVGGVANGGVFAGAFYVSANDASSDALRTIGGRLAF